MSTIDLGEPKRHAPGEAPLRRIVRRGMRGVARRCDLRRRPASTVTVAAMVLTLVASALGVPAEARPEVHGLATTTETAGAVTAQGWIFWAERAGQNVAAAPVGAPVAWTFRAGRTVGGLSVADSVVQVVLPAVAATAQQRAVAGEVIGLDARTGAERWHRAGTVIDAPGVPLLILQDGQAVVGSDRATGQERWRWTGDTRTPVPVAGGRAGVSFWRWDAAAGVGRGVLIDLQTGAAQDLPMALTGRFIPQAVVREPLTVFYQRRGDPNPPETRIARADGDRAITRLGGDEHLRVCGRMLCVVGDSSVRAVDADGRTVWGRGLALWLGARVVSLPDGTQAMLLALGRSPDAPKALLDPRSGEIIAELGAWLPLGVHNGRMLVIQESREAGLPAWLGVVEGRSVRTLHLLGTASGCHSGDGWLVCRDLRPDARPGTKAAAVAGAQRLGDLLGASPR
ncbi:MAG: hypothetical protein HOV79_20550 [Hamadaea sp.]|nr:hypothetical protein [Hamadaea sp.]